MSKYNTLSEQERVYSDHLMLASNIMELVIYINFSDRCKTIVIVGLISISMVIWTILHDIIT